jgi:hypothetical protein
MNWRVNEMKKLKLGTVLCSIFLLLKVEHSDCLDVTASSTNVNAFDSFYFGGGGGYNFIRYDSYRLSVPGALTLSGPNLVVMYDQQKVSRPMGTFVLGGGKVFYDWLYIGIEGLVDIAGAKTESVRVDGYATRDKAHDSDGGYVVHEGGVLPQVGIRLGYVDKSSDIMFYTRPSIAFTETVLYNDNDRRDILGPQAKLDGEPRRATFAVALGIEKVIFADVSARLEGEYLFEKPWEVNSLTAHKGVDTGWRTKAKTRSYNVRFLLTYNCKY